MTGTRVFRFNRTSGGRSSPINILEPLSFLAFLIMSVFFLHEVKPSRIGPFLSTPNTFIKSMSSYLRLRFRFSRKKIFNCDSTLLCWCMTNPCIRMFRFLLSFSRS
uniref:Uncharacterized protein n=1 Tax=Cacopsylla melanoneura TaxID=428564 RepID=A0A8D8T4F5_9HEMI